MVKKEIECEYVDGKLTGYYYNWYDNGQLAIKYFN